MNLATNGVYAVGPEIGPGRRLRVLLTEALRVHVINVDEQSAEPFGIGSGDITSLRWVPTEDPWAGLRATHDDDLTPLSIGRRDRAYLAIQDLLELARADAPPDCHPLLRLLDTDHRFRLIAAVAKKKDTPMNTVRRWLIRHWVRGMCKNALLPDVITMSGIGTTRAVPTQDCDSQGNLLDPNRHPKPGRKSKNGTRRGTRMTAPVRESIEELGRKLYLDHPRNSVHDTYVAWKDEKKPIAPHRYPSPQVFYAVLTKDAAIKAEIKKRGFAGRKPRGGAAEKEAMHPRVPGPGFCYQGDSTPLPRIKVDGKGATLYFTSDTFTSGVPGYYVYCGKPSAAAHSRCLAHAAADKVTYCKRFGMEITKEQWPMSVVPEAWVADRGELIGPIADYMVSSFHIALQNTPAYSPQLKADVEAAFGVMLRLLLSKLDDHVTPRPGRKYGETINLTMHELHVLIILFILAYNSRKLPQVATPSQMARKVEISPLGLWNKEVDRLSGEGAQFTAEELLLATTKRSKRTKGETGPTLDESGLHFEGLTYVCAEPGVAAYQSQLGSRSKAVSLQHDEDSVDRVFIQRKQLHRLGVATVGPLHEYIECPLDKRDAAWVGYTLPAYKAAYEKHTEDTQGLYEKADQRMAALVAGIARQNAGKTTAPETSEEEHSSMPPESPGTTSAKSTDGTPVTSANAEGTSDSNREPSPSSTLKGAAHNALRRMRNQRIQSTP